MPKEEPEDGVVLEYASVPCGSMKEAQRAACIEILSWILLRAPGCLKTHVNQWHGDCLERVRNEAVRLHEQLQTRVFPRLWFGQLHPTRGAPSVRGQSLTAAGGQYLTAGSEEKERRVLEALNEVPINKINTGRTGLPPNVWPVLEANLPRGGLHAFLQQYPEKFRIVAGPTLAWQRIS